MNNPYGGPPHGPGQQPFGQSPQHGGQPYGAPPPQGGQPYGPPAQQRPPSPQQFGAGQAPQYGPPRQAPGGYPSQPYAQPAQPPAHTPGPPGIMLDTSYFPLMFILALFGPRIEVDGQQLPDGKWGPAHLPVPPGQHRVRVSTRYLWTFGAAETVVHLAPGESAPLYYKAPAFALFVDGAIGQVPQKTPGLVALLIVSLLPVLVCFLSFIVLIAASA